MAGRGRIAWTAVLVVLAVSPAAGTLLGGRAWAAKAAAGGRYRWSRTLRSGMSGGDVAALRVRVGGLPRLRGGRRRVRPATQAALARFQAGYGQAADAWPGRPPMPSCMRSPAPTAPRCISPGPRLTTAPPAAADSTAATEGRLSAAIPSRQSARTAWLPPRTPRPNQPRRRAAQQPCGQGLPPARSRLPPWLTTSIGHAGRRPGQPDCTGATRPDRVQRASDGPPRRGAGRLTAHSP
jgi:hypothetical protein